MQAECLKTTRHLPALSLSLKTFGIHLPSLLKSSGEVLALHYHQQKPVHLTVCAFQRDLHIIKAYNKTFLYLYSGLLK